MVIQVGAHAVAAVGLTTQPKFIGLAAFTAVNVAVSALVARRKGEGRRKEANQVLVGSCIFTVCMTVAVKMCIRDRSYLDYVHSCLREEYGVKELSLYQIGATIGVHTGPYPLGLGLIERA